MNTFSAFILPMVIYFITIFSGFWLSYLGKPYRGLLFNIHKLLALIAVVVITMQITRLFKYTSISVPLMGLLLMAILSVLFLFASGTLLSLDRLPFLVMKNIHRVATAALVSILLIVTALAC